MMNGKTPLNGVSYGWDTRLGRPLILNEPQSSVVALACWDFLFHNEKKLFIPRGSYREEAASLPSHVHCSPIATIISLAGFIAQAESKDKQDCQQATHWLETWFACVTTHPRPEDKLSGKTEGLHRVLETHYDTWTLLLLTMPHLQGVVWQRYGTSAPGMGRGVTLFDNLSYLVFQVLSSVGGIWWPEILLLIRYTGFVVHKWVMTM